MQTPGEVAMERRAAEPARADMAEERLDPVTGDVLMQVVTELASMMSLLGKGLAARRIAEIQAQATAFLHQIARLMVYREVNPWTRLRLTPDEPPASYSPTAARVGVIPLAANPIHWGHLLSGLSVMIQARLDKIVFVITRDSYPEGDLFPEELRRGAAAEAIAIFQPFFTLVPGSAGRLQTGPASLIRLLGLNSQQIVEAFYVSGYESCTPASINETTDALVKEGRASFGQSGRLPRVSIVSIGAWADETPGLSDARVLVVPSPLPGFSDGTVRAALRSSQRREELAGLPACVFRHFRMLSAFD